MSIRTAYSWSGAAAPGSGGAVIRLPRAEQDVDHGEAADQAPHRGRGAAEPARGEDRGKDRPEARTVARKVRLHTGTFGITERPLDPRSIHSRPMRVWIDMTAPAHAGVPAAGRPSPCPRGRGRDHRARLCADGRPAEAARSRGRAARAARRPFARRQARHHGYAPACASGLGEGAQVRRRARARLAPPHARRGPSGSRAGTPSTTSSRWCSTSSAAGQRRAF